MTDQATANYRRSQIERIQKVQGPDPLYHSSIKIIAPIADDPGTNYMDVTPAELEEIKAILARVE